MGYRNSHGRDKHPRRDTGFTVYVKRGHERESLDKAIRRLKKRMNDEQFFQELTKRRFYTKPSEKRRLAKKAGTARFKKAQAKARENEYGQ